MILYDRDRKADGKVELVPSRTPALSQEGSRANFQDQETIGDRGDSCAVPLARGCCTRSFGVFFCFLSPVVGPFLRSSPRFGHFVAPLPLYFSAISAISAMFFHHTLQKNYCLCYNWY